MTDLYGNLMEPWLQITDKMWLEWIKYTVKVYYSIANC